jgi:hypothetical protein
MLERMRLAGIHVGDEDLLELADRLRSDGDDALAHRIEVAYYRDARQMVLSRSDRDAILVALTTDCPDSLIELRGKLAGDLTGVLN